MNMVSMAFSLQKQDERLRKQPECLCSGTRNLTEASVFEKHKAKLADRNLSERIPTWSIHGHKS